MRASESAKRWGRPETLWQLPRPSWLRRETVRQAEARLLVLCQKANCVPESPPATSPANFMQELARLRDLVQELQQERDELRSEFADQGQSAREDGRRKKSSKSLATPSPDFAQPQLNQIVTRGASGRNLSSMMETMIDRAEAAGRSGQSGPMNLS